MTRYPLERYGKWAGNERGYSYNSRRCAKEVWPSDGWVSKQCSRRRGYGIDKLFCKQHKNTTV
jgi:hypothetical protein